MHEHVRLVDGASATTIRMTVTRTRQLVDCHEADAKVTQIPKSQCEFWVALTHSFAPNSEWSNERTEG